SARAPVAARLRISERCRRSSRALLGSRQKSRLLPVETDELDRGRLPPTRLFFDMGHGREHHVVPPGLCNNLNAERQPRIRRGSACAHYAGGPSRRVVFAGVAATT